MLGLRRRYYIARCTTRSTRQASLVGSIGVTAAGFGFVDTLKKAGCRSAYLIREVSTRRLLDPFSRRSLKNAPSEQDDGCSYP